MSTPGATAFTHRAQRLGGWAVFGPAALTAWVVGALPWIVSGLRLEISEAWPSLPPGGTPRVALPFGEYAFQPLVVVGVIGGAAAVGVSLLARRGTSRPRLIAAGGGLLGLTVALVQTVLVVKGALAVRSEARLLVVALVAVVLVATVLGTLTGAGLVARRGWAWVLGAALVSALVGPWLNDLVHRAPASDGAWTSAVTQWHPWLGGALLGFALAVDGLRTMGRLAVWIGALALLWVVPAALIALNYVTYYGTHQKLGPGVVAEVLDAGRDVFVAALAPGVRTFGPVVLAAMIGTAAVLGRSLRPRGEGRADPAASSAD